jgi:stage V sporulation protein B
VGRVDIPVKILSVGMVIKIVLNYILVGIPKINIQGASIGTLSCYVFVFFASFYCLSKEVKIKVNIKSVFFKPFVASVFCACCAYLVQNLVSTILPYKLATLIAVLISAIVYVIATFALGTLSKSDLKMLPKGGKIINFLEKHKIM